ncbi:hypothetical protein CPC16_005914 [Podila verticillata]|nr:hypothetical protein CPC16_005914 [Podila verticillata]
MEDPFILIKNDVLASLSNASALYESYKRILQTVTSAQNEELVKTKEELLQILVNIEQDLEDLDDAALLEDAGSSSPRGYQKPSRRENMMYSNTKFIEQEAQQQQILMQEQDQQLDGVMHTVLNMREIATVMNTELQDQSMLLDDLDDHVDRTSGRLQKTMKRMNKFIKDNEGKDSTAYRIGSRSKLGRILL